MVNGRLQPLSGLPKKEANGWALTPFWLLLCKHLFFESRTDPIIRSIRSRDLAVVARYNSAEPFRLARLIMGYSYELSDDNHYLIQFCIAYNSDQIPLRLFKISDS